MGVLEDFMRTNAKACFQDKITSDINKVERKLMLKQIRSWSSCVIDGSN